MSTPPLSDRGWTPGCAEAWVMPRITKPMERLKRISYERGSALWKVDSEECTFERFSVFIHQYGGSNP